MADKNPDDPDQVSYFADDPDGPLPEAKDVVIGGDKKPAAGDKAPKNPSNDTPVPDADRGMDELKRQLDAERENTRKVAEAARQQQIRAERAEQRAGMATTGMIDNAIEAAAHASERARQKFEDALAAGDHRMASTAQLEIADSRHNLLRLQEQKAIVEQEAADRKARPPQQQPQQHGQPDMAMVMRNVTDNLERSGFRKSADWVREHPEQVANQIAVNRLEKAHGYITDVLGIRPEGEGYFEKLEEVLGLDGGGERARQSAHNAGNGAQRRASAAAPVSRAAPSLRSGEGRRTIHLSPEQRAHARDVLGMSDEEYAASLADAIDRGKIIGAR